MVKLVSVGVLALAGVGVASFLHSNPQFVQQILQPNVQSNEQETSRNNRGQISAKATPAKRHLLSHQYAIRAGSNGHFNATFKLNNRNVDALIDTGATMVAINRSTARRIGLKLKNRDFKHPVSTANGKTKAAAVLIKEMAIGSIILNDVKAAVLKDNALSTTLIGMSFLNRLSGFKISSGELILER